MRTCLDCGHPIKGRSDKKFCSDLCRNNYHNRMNKGNEKFVRNVQNILRRNRRILSALIVEEFEKVHRDELIFRGFNFTFHTHSFTTKKGQTYYFCFDHGYYECGKDYYNLIPGDDNLDQESMD